MEQSSATLQRLYLGIAPRSPFCELPLQASHAVLECLAEPLNVGLLLGCISGAVELVSD